jgi:hypothetical protein
LTAFEPEPMPIDPGERILAAIGVRPVISKEVEKIRRADRLRALNIPREIARAARRVCTEDMPTPRLDDGNYMNLLRDLTQGYQPEQVEAMLATLPPDAQADVGMPFLSVARKSFDYLATRLPKSAEKTIAGSTPLPPNDSAWWSFLGVFGALDSPLSVFDLMGAGMLLKSQVEAVREIYPTLSDLIDEELTAAIAHEKAQKKSYQLPFMSEIGVRSWFGTPIDLRPYQAAYEQPNKNPKPESQPNESPLSKSVLSDAQQTLYDQLRR